ncbi:Deoxynucleoside triphosphate triphosphohydrolase SAMHD1-like [Vitis vinifera]|uniref:Deoxynucleoside triphosphate triphosphohydrolase SAMHD1-like n=1 Tax=Vitis vinifera TaxID=29760 RepID=A0A438JIW8_VITVI|nr:Deoxynucleoside triphosphate triphosphohydrolase SAMHD1-like [Vitis vinifera]
MGAHCNGDVAIHSFACSQDFRFSKRIYDNVHGNIYLDPLFLKFMDTEQFQRLRDLKQLGESSPVYFLIYSHEKKMIPSLMVYLEIHPPKREAQRACSLRDSWFHLSRLHRIGLRSQGIPCLAKGITTLAVPCMAHMVYPGAVHSRFEHSLGVYWLAGQAIHKLKTQQGFELGIDCFDIRTVKLAGLLHDIGHGPYSHLFEREFLPRVHGGRKWSHEQMSVKMVDYIVDEHHIDIDSETIKQVKEMIVASCGTSQAKSSREKHFLYDIVANGRNGIDVDKFDYIVRDSRACGLGCNVEFQRIMEDMRVLGDEICYRYKDYLTIYKLFATRADLYRTVYTHAKVKAIDLMVLDALVKANDYLEISSHIDDPAQYWKLDDTIIKTIETAPDQELRESRDLIRRIRRRDLYRFCNEYAVPRDKLENFKDVTVQDIVCSQKNGAILREEDVVVDNVKIDLTRGKHNPLERYFKRVGIYAESEEVISFPT